MFFMLGTYLLVGLNRIGEVNLLQVASNLLVLVCLIAGIGVGAGAAGLLLLNWLAWLLTATLLLACLARHAANRKAVPLPKAAAGCDVRFDRPHAAARTQWPIHRLPKTLSAYRFRFQIFREGIHYSIKAYLCCLLAFVVLRLNVFLLQGSRGEAEVGIYSVAAQAADVLIIVPTSLALVLLPRFVQNQDHAWRLLWRSLAETAAFMLAACVAAAWLVTPAIQFAFGTAYLAAAPMLIWMLPGVFFLGMSSIVSQYLAANGIPRRSIGIWAVAVLLQCLLGLWLIPLHGGVAAAATFSIVYAVNFALQLGLACSVAKQRYAAPPQTTIQPISTIVSSSAAA
jgi:O-antigen/teichoic acid export membrane protein